MPLRKLILLSGLALVLVAMTPAAAMGAAKGTDRPLQGASTSTDTATATGDSYGAPILGGVYNIAISASSGPSGENPSGTVSFDLLINRIDHPQPFLINYAGPVTCLNVQGNTAILNADTSEYGLATVELTDNGGGGADNFRFGFGNAPTDCSSFPGSSMADVPLQAGRAVVYDASTTPTTTVLVPSTGATLSGTSAVLDASASASAGVAKVEFVLTGGSYSQSVIGTATPTLYGYIALWDTTGPSNGPYTLQSLVTGADGQTAYSPGIAITVNNVPPSTAIVIPANPVALVTGTSVLLDATVSPGTYPPATSVVFQIYIRGSERVIATATPTIWGWIAFWDSTSVPNGCQGADTDYALQSVAAFPGGATATSGALFVSVLNPLPSTTLGVPSNGATVTGGQWLDASASPGTTDVDFELTGGTLTNYVIATGTPTYFGWLGGFDSTTVPNGSYTLTSRLRYGPCGTWTSPGVSITISN
jgi:hypothetical protein